MAEQAISMRSLAQVLRRRWKLLALAAVVGADLGVGLVVARPPAYLSTSAVLLSSGGTQEPSEQRDMDTEVRIAGSGVVLEPARSAVQPPLSRRELDARLNIESTAGDVIAITASGATRASAERLASAVADSLVDYHARATSSLSQAQQDALRDRRASLAASLETVQEQIDTTSNRLEGVVPESVRGEADATALATLTAHQADLVLQLNALEERATNGTDPSGATVIEAASPARRPHMLAWIVLCGLLGSVVVVAVSAAVLLILSRQDTRLRSRDEIADALGRPVLASLRTRPARDPSGWRALLVDYTPEVEADLGLRQTLLTIGIQPNRLAPPGSSSRKSATARLTVVSLANDPEGLAVAPQLAAHAAALGVPTRLVVTPGQPSSAALAAACSGQARDEALRTNLWVDTRLRKAGQVQLTIVSVTIDRDDPESASLRLAPRAMIALSAGAASAEEVARAAVWAYDCGGRVLGALVANPDALDRTTGRLLHNERSQQVTLPTRLTGIRPTPLHQAPHTSEGSA